MYYECVVCLELNHASRPHCQYCGAIPAQYSILGCASRIVEHEHFTQFISVIAAFGCARSSQRRAARTYLRTVPATYYAES
jgi:hypothetical protein